MEQADHGNTLEQRIKDEGFEIAFDPPGDGMCFYASAAYQLESGSPEDVKDAIFEYLQKNRYDEKGEDRLNFISDADIGGKEVPNSWLDALNLLKKEYANDLIIKMLPDVLNYNVKIITVHGNNRDEYIITYIPKKGPSPRTLYFGHKGNHYVALKKRIERTNEVINTDDQLVTDLEGLSIKDKPYADWFENHPWEDAKLREEFKLEDIQKSNKYEVGSKWTSGGKIKLEKIIKDLPSFLKEMKKPSAYDELKTELHAQNITPIRDESVNSPSTHAKEISLNSTGMLPTQEKILPKSPDEKKYVAWSLSNGKESSTPELTRNTDASRCIDVDGYMLEISIPTPHQTFSMSDDAVCTPNKSSLKKRWIFTPSYLRASCARFDWSDTGIDKKNTIRIVVVRPSQFEEYMKHCGNHLPIVRLPDDVIGVGYARYWIQKIATAFGLEYIWMIDDSLKTFYEVNPDEVIEQNDCKKRKRSFEEVFKEIEEYFKDNKKLAAMSPARFRGGVSGQEPFTCKSPLIAVYLNLTLINEKNVRYRPQLPVLEDVVFAAECANKGLIVLRWKRIQLEDTSWQKSGAAVYSSSEKKLKSNEKQTAPNQRKESARRYLNYKTNNHQSTPKAQSPKSSQKSSQKEEDPKPEKETIKKQSTPKAQSPKSSQNPSQKEEDPKPEKETIKKQSTPKAQSPKSSQNRSQKEEDPKPEKETIKKQSTPKTRNPKSTQRKCSEIFDL